MELEQHGRPPRIGQIHRPARQSILVAGVAVVWRRAVGASSSRAPVVPSVRHDNPARPALTFATRCGQVVSKCQSHEERWRTYDSRVGLAPDVWLPDEPLAGIKRQVRYTRPAVTSGADLEAMVCSRLGGR